MPGPDHEAFHRVRSPFEGKLVRLRAIEEEDLPRINDLFNDPDVLQYLSAVTFPQGVEATRGWWDSTRGRADQATFAIETLPGEVLGVCSLESIDRRARTAVLGIWIGKPFWGKGYGTDAVRTLCRFGFREMNLQRVTLHVLETNPRGKRAYERVGFKEEGRMRRAAFIGGRHVDVTVMGVLDDELIED